MKRKRIIIVALLFFVFSSAIILYLRTPLFFRHVASILEYRYGYRIHAEEIYFSPALKGRVTDFQIEKPEAAFLFAGAEIDIEGKPLSAIRGEVEKLYFREPRLQFRLDGKKEKEDTGDVSFIKKIPPVALLSVQNGELRLIYGDSGEITFGNINLNVRRFSPVRGGDLTFEGLVNVRHPGDSALDGSGRCKGVLNLTGLFPKPRGTGSFEFYVDSMRLPAVSLEKTTIRFDVKIKNEDIVISGIDVTAGSIFFRDDGNQTAIKGFRLRADGSYNLKSKEYSVTNCRGEIPSLGHLCGHYRGSFGDPSPWSAHVESPQINFAGLFKILRPFIEKTEYKDSSIDGGGRLEADFTGSGAAFTGKASLFFSKGGFSSADGTKAAQGIEGELILRFTKPRGGKKTSVDIRTEISSGEYLFGTYYKNLEKGRDRLSINGNMLFDDKESFEFSGSFNFFDTGEYSCSGSRNKEHWLLSFDAEDISTEKMMSVVLSEFIDQNYPSFKGSRVRGGLSTRVRFSGRGKGFVLRGNLRVKDMHVTIPEKSLSAKGVSIDLPFDLHYPSKMRSGTRSRNGGIRIGAFEKGAIKFVNMDVPFLVTANNLLIPGEIDLPFYGGAIKIIQCKAEDVLSEDRKFNFAAKIENVDFSSLLMELTGLQLPGNVEAHFPLLGYEGGRWLTKDTTTVKIFGGTIEITRAGIENLLSEGRIIKGDILFRDIDLGKTTDAIEIGKIKGVINGFIKDLEIEYGQPSRFVFEIDSVKTRGVEQKISVDAIENLSIIGSGSKAVGAVLKSGINRFFKEYPYSKIGIRCALANDTFRVNGKIHEGNREYLIRKSLFRGIDVINRSPENTISFKDMQERVNRVFKKDSKPSFTTGTN